MPTVIKHTTNNLVTVSYPVREATIDITHAEHSLILDFSHEKVKMIKFIRAQYNLGLYDAKQVVDTVIASAEVKPTIQVNLIAEAGETEVDWSKVKEGTWIHVRDNEYDSWIQREFIAYDQYKYYRFVCGDNLEGTVGWKYAKLLSAM